MVSLFDLLVPILVAAVGVFIASSVIHMALPIHKSDFKKMPGEEAVAEAMRAQGVTPGDYAMPQCSSMKEMASPEMMEKYKQGPVAWVTVLPNGPMHMGKCLGQWFVFCILISIFAAYLGKLALPAGAEYLKVFQVTGATAMIGYGIGQMTNSIWKGVAWSTTVKFIFDGLVYALVTAGIFGSMWPAAA